jgi:hypothetical protein
MFGDAGQHARPDLLLVMESENEVRATRSLQDPMRSGLAFDDPPERVQGG